MNPWLINLHWGLFKVIEKNGTKFSQIRERGVMIMWTPHLKKNEIELVLSGLFRYPEIRINHLIWKKDTLFNIHLRNLMLKKILAFGIFSPLNAQISHFPCLTFLMIEHLVQGGFFSLMKQWILAHYYCINSIFTCSFLSAVLTIMFKYMNNFTT